MYNYNNNMLRTLGQRISHFLTERPCSEYPVLYTTPSEDSIQQFKMFREAEHFPWALS